MITKGFVRLLKDIIHKIQFRVKIKQMDSRWNFIGAYSWELFPPSFYYTHSEKEIKRITEETRAKLLALIAGLEDDDCC